METELYKKVIIKSEDDLPKEEGVYFCHVKDLDPSENGMDIMDWRNDPYVWLNTFDWYLLPVEQTKESKGAEDIADKYSHYGKLSNGENCFVLEYTDAIKAMEEYAQSQTEAKELSDEEKLKNHFMSEEYFLEHWVTQALLTPSDIRSRMAKRLKWVRTQLNLARLNK